MQKRIFLHILGSILITSLLLAVVSSYLFFNTARQQEISAIKDKACLVAEILNSEPTFALKNINTPFDGSRITIISDDGTVLLDSHAEIDNLGDRYDRPEFQDALHYGSGESMRQSTVFQSQTYYYALQLNNGTILRISRPLTSLGGIFATVLPVLLVVTVIALILTSIIVQKRNEVHKAEQQRREFSANVSHELKTPLTTISALSEMMTNGMAKPEDFTTFAGKISIQAKRLISIIEDIIRLSEFDEKKVKQEYFRFDVFALATYVVEDLQEQAKTKKVSLTLQGNPVEIYANQRLVEELLFNLVENGIKYNREGGEVVLTVQRENGHCKISAADTGIGIPKEHQKHIFERFYRVDNSRARNTGGTGLGLSIVKHIVEHHKGKLLLDSAEEVGTTITCYFPVREEK